MPHPLKSAFIHLVLWLEHTDEIDGEGFSLVGQLEKRVLRIGARFAENHRTSRFAKQASFCIHRFPVAFHVQLLDMGGQFG